MENVKFEVKGNKLIITIDLSYRDDLSTSGKSKRVASTLGQVEVPGHPEIKFGLNAYTKA